MYRWLMVPTILATMLSLCACGGLMTFRSSQPIIVRRTRQPEQQAPEVRTTPSTVPAVAGRDEVRPIGVDANGPYMSGAPQPTAYAVIVGISNYRDLPEVPGARADAYAFESLAKSTLGISEDHIRLIVDEHATKSDIEEQVDWLQRSVVANGRVYFYFAGHGSPDAASAAPFLVPQNGNPTYLERSSLSLAAVTAALGRCKAREVVVFLDTCFSGAGGRSVLPPGARPLVRVKEVSPGPAMAVFAASGGNEISGSDSTGTRGAYSKYLIEGLGSGTADINGDHQISMLELSEWVTPRVSAESRRGGRQQTPKIVLGSSYGNGKDLIIAYGLATR